MLELYNSKFNDKLSQFITSEKFFMLITSLLSAFFLIDLLQLKDKVDFNLSFSLLTLVSIFGLALIKKAFKEPLVIYLGFQMILLSIFIEKKFIVPFSGLNLRIYGAIFGVALICATYYIFKNFKYLWNTFSLFKYLFIYFIINLLYLVLGYNSDFRLSNDLLSRRYFNAGLDVSSGREFGDLAKYVLYIECLIPIISITVSLMLFKGMKTIKEINTRLLTIINYISIITLAHFTLALFAFLIGKSDRFNNLFGDVDIYSNVYLPIMLIILLGFKCYIFNINYKDKLTNFILNISIIYNAVLTLFMLYLSRTPILILITGLTTFYILATMNDIKLFSFTSKNKIKKIDENSHKKKLLINNLFSNPVYIGIFGVTIYALVMMMQGLTSTSHVNSMSMRFDHWRDVYMSWINSVDLIKFIFGFGIDKVRELVYYASFSTAMEQGIVSPHNVFISLFYDQGFVSLLYLGGIFSTFISGFKCLSGTNTNCKILSIMSFSLVISIFSCWIFIDTPLLLKIVIFCLLGFLESAKYAYLLNPGTSEKEEV